MAYAAQRGGKWTVVVDGEEGKPYEDARRPIFGPDGRHVAYTATRGNKSYVVVDGQEGDGYDGVIAGARLAFDGPDALHVLVGESGHQMLFYAGKVLPKGQEPWSAIIFRAEIAIQ